MVIIAKENTEGHNPNWPWILEHPYKILITRGSGSGKTNALLNPIKQQDDDNNSAIDKLYLYAKDPNEAKYQHFIKKHEKIKI